MRDLQEILLDIESRTKYGSDKFYKPLENINERNLIKEYYLEKCFLIGLTRPEKLINNSNTLISNGYERVVVGDYGAYVEFSNDQAACENFIEKWPGKPKRPVKYIWLETNDDLKTKIYLQKAMVSYADYKPGFYYVAPGDVKCQ